MASVSIAARDSLRVSTAFLVSSHDRSSAVRKVHLPPIFTRLTPRVAYSALSRASASLRSTPSGNCRASVASSSGSPAANSNASSRRSSSGARRRLAVATLSASRSRRLVDFDGLVGHVGSSSLRTIASSWPQLGMDSISLCVFLCVMRGCTAARRDTLAHVDRRERLLSDVFRRAPSRTSSSAEAKDDANTVAVIAGSTT